MLRSGIAGSYTSTPFSVVAVPIYICNNSVGRSLFSARDLSISDLASFLSNFLGWGGGIPLLFIEMDKKKFYYVNRLHPLRIH